MSDPVSPPRVRVVWPGARRVIRSLHPPIDLFEDIADPEDWPLIISAEQKTNPRLMNVLGAIDLVPPKRRVGGAGSSFLMAPFTHVSEDRPNRFSRGTYGVLYVGDSFETALFETMHHHARFMASTSEPPGWTSQFRELFMDVSADLHDIRGGEPAWATLLDTANYAAAQGFAEQLRGESSEGIVYPSVRYPEGECAGLFYPDLASNVVQGRHLDYHWDGVRVNMFRDAGTGDVFRVGS